MPSGSRPASLRVFLASAIPQAMRSTSAPRVNITRSACSAERAMTLGPLAATSTGTLASPLQAIGDPADAAGRRGVMQVQAGQRRRRLMRDVDVVEAHRLAAEVKLELSQVTFELGEARRCAAEMGERRI